MKRLALVVSCCLLLPGCFPTGDQQEAVFDANAVPQVHNPGEERTQWGEQAQVVGTVDIDGLPVLSAGQAVEGLYADLQEEAGELYKLYRYRGQPGELIMIEMQSNDFDTTLTVGSGSPSVGEGRCNGCVHNDDAGSGTNSRLRYFVPDSGDVWIRAGAFESGGSGRYRLHISSLPRPPAASEMNLQVGGQVSQQLGDNSPLDEEMRPYHWWRVQGSPGQRVVVRMQSEDFDALLQVGHMANGRFHLQNTNDDSGSSTDARLIVTLDGNGQASVRALSFDPGGTGRYTLMAMNSKGQLQTPPTRIDVGTTVRGRLEKSDLLNEKDEEDGYFDVYAINGSPGQRITVQLESSDFDALLRWGIFTQNGFILENEDDDGGDGTNSRMTITLDNQGEGRLLVTSIGYAEGGYTLRVH